MKQARTWTCAVKDEDRPKALRGDRWLTVHDAAPMIGLKESSLYAWIGAGQLATVKKVVGKMERVFVSLRSVRAVARKYPGGSEGDPQRRMKIMKAARARRKIGRAKEAKKEMPERELRKAKIEVQESVDRHQILAAIYSFDAGTPGEFKERFSALWREMAGRPSFELHSLAGEGVVVMSCRFHVICRVRVRGYLQFHSDTFCIRQPEDLRVHLELESETPITFCIRANCVPEDCRVLEEMEVQTGTGWTSEAFDRFADVLAGKRTLHQVEAELHRESSKGIAKPVPNR